MTSGAATPLEPAPPNLARGRKLWLKREETHELGSFKWRGALPVLTRFQADGADTVVSATTGNHGVATVWAASRLELQTVVFVTEHASKTKLALLERPGATVREVGSD